MYSTGAHVFVIEHDRCETIIHIQYSPEARYNMCLKCAFFACEQEVNAFLILTSFQSLFSLMSIRFSHVSNVFLASFDIHDMTVHVLNALMFTGIHTLYMYMSPVEHKCTSS